MVESPEKRSLTDILAEERQRSLELESKMKSALKRTNADAGATDDEDAAAVTQGDDCMVPVIGFLSPTLAALAVQTAASPNTLLMQRVCRTPGKLLRGLLAGCVLALQIQLLSSNNMFQTLVASVLEYGTVP